jgi:hypothetical protein
VFVHCPHVQILTSSQISAQINHPPKALGLFKWVAKSDKLLIDLWGATINVDGIYAVGAVVLIMVVLRWR